MEVCKSDKSLIPLVKISMIILFKISLDIVPIILQKANLPNTVPINHVFLPKVFRRSLRNIQFGESPSVTPKSRVLGFPVARFPLHSTTRLLHFFMPLAGYVFLVLQDIDENVGSCSLEFDIEKESQMYWFPYRNY